MSFVVEDGTGLATANSFISVADADLYHADRRNADAWDDLTDTQKQAYLIEATTWINALEWAAGQPIGDTQALFFPAFGAYDRNGYMIDSDIVPPQVEQAAAELSYRIKDTEVEADQGRQKNKVKVGELAVEYDAYAELEKQYPFVLRLLKGMVRESGAGELYRG